MNIKYLSLIVLIVQTTSHVLLLRYSRTVAVNISGDKSIVYLSSTVVILSEIVKVLACLVILSCSHRFKLSKICSDLYTSIWEKKFDTLKLIVPAGLYVIQNNLLFLALTHLDAAVYQVTYQLKILTTALFSVLLLQKKLSCPQWSALFLLMLGVILVQWPDGELSDSRISNIQQELLGLIAILLACMCSGFAGVYFEKLLKGTSQSIWMRNVQLGSFSVILGALGLLINDLQAIQQEGFFQGYNMYTWLVIISQAFGGLVIAVVIKYADNILKGFAASLSIILSAVFSYFLLHDFVPSVKFFIGCPIVVGSTILYGSVKSR
ncbi:UDP-N-acetylglucosamine transporter [Nymphon striatum]|nr:UDP-N-acetylglucosamine transporter [Nymphon striatum]